MIPDLHFISGWAVPVGAWEPVRQTLASTVNMIVYEPAGWLADPPAPSPDAYLGGWSLGGLLALQTAAAQPAAWRGLLLVGATARFCRGPDQEWGTPPRYLDRMIRKLDTAPKEVLGRFLRPQRPAAWSGGNELRPMDRVRSP